MDITWDIICANPNLTYKIFSNNHDKLNNFWHLSLNLLYYHEHFESPVYQQRVAMERLRIYKEELIKVSYHPRRMLQTTHIDASNPLYGLTDLPQ